MIARGRHEKKLPSDFGLLWPSFMEPGALLVACIETNDEALLAVGTIDVIGSGSTA